MRNWYKINISVQKEELIKNKKWCSIRGTDKNIVYNYKLSSINIWKKNWN